MGADLLVDGQGTMDWRLAGIIPVVRVEVPDMARSSAGRVAGEAVWIPTAMLPRFGVTWHALDEHHAATRFPVGTSTSTCTASSTTTRR